MNEQELLKVCYSQSRLDLLETLCQELDLKLSQDLTEAEILAGISLSISIMNQASALLNCRAFELLVESERTTWNSQSIPGNASCGLD